jgi:hypothetical protein
MVRMMFVFKRCSFTLTKAPNPLTGADMNIFFKKFGTDIYSPQEKSIAINARTRTTKIKIPSTREYDISPLPVIFLITEYIRIIAMIPNK